MDLEIVRRNGWYVGEGVQWYPTRRQMASLGSFEEWVLKGWAPSEPFITRDTRIAAFGSCFAQEISSFLFHRGFNVNLMRDSMLGKQESPYLARFGAGFNNALSIEQQFRFAYTNWNPSPGTWVDHEGLPVDAAKWKPRLTRMFHDTELFILTVGVAEVWRDSLSGEALWRAPRKEDFEKGRHVFEVTTVEENYRCLKRVVEMLHEHRPGARVLFTVSPVPLKATFRPVSCITANEVSKSICRVAVDLLMRDEIPGVYYFPGYELVRVVAFNPYGDDGRHVNASHVRPLMESFLEAYAVGSERHLSTHHFVGATNVAQGKAMAEEVAETTGRTALRLDSYGRNLVLDVQKQGSGDFIWHGPYVHLFAWDLARQFPNAGFVLVHDPQGPEPSHWPLALSWRLKPLVDQIKGYQRASVLAFDSVKHTYPNRVLHTHAKDSSGASAFLESLT